MSATVTVSGMTRMGAAVSASLTVPFAASGKERMDLVVVDPGTRTISRVAGAERTAQLDALEWQGNPGGQTIVGRARVTDGAVTTVETGLWRGVTFIGQNRAEEARIARNRCILAPLVAAATAGSAITLGGYGDSITALQSNVPDYVANGILRDRALSYLANYPADTKALVATYDTGDGAGQVHTRLGWNWHIKAALEALGGSSVSYLNYGIGATTSQNTEPVAGRGNGLWPARIAVPLGAGLDAVVIGFGMNERGQSYTYANIVNMIGQFQGAGAICIVIGCPRPNANQDAAAWRLTNDALESAAHDAGAAFVSTTAIADDGLTLGGIGVPAESLASANTISGGNNHPGIWELTRYGESAVRQLGLG